MGPPPHNRVLIVRKVEPDVALDATPARPSGA
jgi:hypothetical protein